MTCLFQTQTINSSSSSNGGSGVDVIDFRAFATVDNSPVFQLPGYDGCFDNSSHGYDLGWNNGQSSTQMDIQQLTIGDEFFFEDFFHSPSFGGGGGGGGHVASASTSPSPSQCSISPGNTSSSSSSSSSLGGSGRQEDECSAVGAETWQSKCSGREDIIKVCGVCGDKALGFNFDAISCESCKAFFRRNAPKGLGYFKCPYDEKCQMNISNRRFCKRCRLKKCLQVGMKKEYILTDEEKATKRRKIQENRHLKKMTLTTTNSSSSNNNTIDTISTTTTAAMPFEQISSIFEESLFQLTPDWQTMETDEWKPATAQQQQPLPQPLQSSSCDDNWTKQSGRRCLSAESSLAIDDLRASYRNSLRDVSFDGLQTLTSSSKDQKNLTDLVNIAELSVRRVIAMVKQVTSFRRLPQVEQIHLLKGGSIDLLIIRSVITFDEEKQHFLDPVDNEDTGAVTLRHLQTAEVGLGLFDDHMRFLRSLVSDLRADETTLVLLLVISLFSPDRENLTWKEFVSREQERYSMLLKEYLESIHPLHLARKLFPKLLMKLTDIRNLNEDHSQVLLKMRPEGIHPLMKEVLDLTT